MDEKQLKFKLELHGPVGVDEFMKTDGFKAFTERCVAYRDQCEEKARRILREEGNEKALAILNRWIAGECVSELQDEESGGRRAHDLILWLCSMGCG